MTTKHSCRRFNWLSARLVMSAVWFDPENAKGFSFTSWVQNLKSTSKLPDHPRTMCPSEAWVTLRGCYVGAIRLSTDYRKVTLRIGNSLVQISNLLLIGQTKRPAVPTWSDGRSGFESEVWQLNNLSKKYLDNYSLWHDRLPNFICKWLRDWQSGEKCLKSPPPPTDITNWFTLNFSNCKKPTSRPGLVFTLWLREVCDCRRKKVHFTHWAD